MQPDWLVLIPSHDEARVLVAFVSICSVSLMIDD